MISQSKTCPELGRRIENPKSEDSAECISAGGESDSMKALRAFQWFQRSSGCNVWKQNQKNEF
jgi:hypothetical protein